MREEKCHILVLEVKKPSPLVNPWETVEIFKITWGNPFTSVSMAHLIKIIQVWKKKDLEKKGP